MRCCSHLVLLADDILRKIGTSAQHISSADLHRHTRR